MKAHSLRSHRLGQLGAAVVAVILLGACSKGSTSGLPTTSLEPATTTTVADTTFEKLSANILASFSSSGSAHLRSIMNKEKADCMATGYLNIPGYRELFEQSANTTNFEEVPPPANDTRREKTRKVFWRCLTVPEIVQDMWGQNGDCCRDIYPESTLACLDTELAKMDKETLIANLNHWILSQPLEAKYAATVTACGISLAE